MSMVVMAAMIPDNGKKPACQRAKYLIRPYNKRKLCRISLALRN
jgi:hypothetical protein